MYDKIHYKLKKKKKRKQTLKTAYYKFHLYKICKNFQSNLYEKQTSVWLEPGVKGKMERQGAKGTFQAD